VGGGAALSPCIPEALHTRLPGGSTKPPVLRGTGLVEGAVSPEKFKGAEKPGEKGQVRQTTLLSFSLDFLIVQSCICTENMTLR
jgi:hypothetical protein